MKVLIVTAHPCSTGFTHRIAHSYSKVSKEKGNQVEILNLYDKKYFQPFLSFTDIRKDFPITSTTKSIQKKIADSEELVFIHPMWWGSMPAVMKNFVDSNFTAHFAFKYTKNGFPEGLLKGKRARVFVTSDGPALLYKLYLNQLKKNWCQTILRFCGLEVASYTHFGSMRKKDEKARDNLLRKVESIARK